ncbi:hypothetical protein TorRG33x02_198270 [Trema orientale]|uniref:NLP1-9 GAF domain-containing protein n=1 Tax=Trema orientale TaxID=63057 RepID=A0A2P5EFP6_TREOI|nr:hypothetical protein TorRG33x02_198270 [Trema orientale]
MIEGSRSPPPTLPLGSCRSREMSAMVSALTIVCGLKPDLQTPQNAIDEELAEENHDCSGTEERHTPTETLDLLQTNSEASNPENPHLDAKAYSNDYVEYPPPLSEIHEVVRVACQSHRLPLAQIWLPGTYFTMHYSVPMGNPLAMDFRDVCFRRPLLKGQGIVGEAFATRKPCFSTDVASYCTAKYPLSHFAKMCGLQGAIAIPAYWTRSISPSDHRFIPDYVLELFLPLDCTDVSEQKNIVMSLLSLLTLRLSVVDAEVQHSTGTDDSLFRNDNATKTLDGKLQEQWSRDDQNFIEIMRQALLHDADNYCQDSFTSVAESGTSEGVEKTTDLPAGSLKDAEKSSTQGRRFNNDNTNFIVTKHMQSYRSYIELVSFLQD